MLNKLTLATIVLLACISGEMAWAQGALEPVASTWWGDFANAAITALATMLTAAVPVVGLALRSMIISRSKVAAAVYDKVLGDKMNDGAIAIIRGIAEKLKQKLPPPTTTKMKAAIAAGKVLPPVSDREAIVATAKPLFEQAFKESLEHFGKSGESVTNYLLGRVEEALKPKPAVVVAVPSPQV